MSPAVIAPGIARTIALSTISITMIETVSAANAIRARRGTRSRPPARLERQAVPEDECEDDRKDDRGQVVPAELGRDASPRTSPMPQPVRQWTVAWNASRLRESEGAAWFMGPHEDSQGDNVS